MWLYLKASRMSAVSTAVKESIVAVCPPAEPLVKVIPNPIDTAIFKPPRWPRNYSSRKTILYAGRVHPAKGLDLLIRSVRRIYVGGSKDIHLKIVGPWAVAEGGGGKSFVEKLSGEAVGLPVELCGPIYDKRKLARVYQEKRMCSATLQLIRERRLAWHPWRRWGQACQLLCRTCHVLRSLLYPDKMGSALTIRPRIQKDN